MKWFSKKIKKLYKYPYIGMKVIGEYTIDSHFTTTPCRYIGEIIRIDTKSVRIKVDKLKARNSELKISNLVYICAQNNYEKKYYNSDDYRMQNITASKPLKSIISGKAVYCKKA